MKKPVLFIISFLLVVVLGVMAACSSTTSTATTTTTTTMTTTTTTTPNQIQTVVPVAPGITALNPLDGMANVPINASITVTFNQPMSSTTITTNSFTLWQGTTQVPATVIFDSPTAILDPVNDLAKDTTYTAKISSTATDMAGVSLPTDFTWSFTTGEEDTLGPMVLGTVPSFAVIIPPDSNNPFGSNTNVPIDNEITAYFNEALDPTTINADTFTLMQGTTLVSGVVSYDGIKTISFKPANNLLPNTAYTATITTGVTDLSGNPLSQNFSWDFTTGPAQTTVPAVVSTIPNDTDTGVPLNTSITANFSEAMDPLTINNDNFTLWQGAIPVSGTVSFDGVHTAVFYPTQDLNMGVTYTAMISTGVTDLAGIHMASSYSWSFTTGAANATAPTIISTNPADAATNVSVNVTILVTFSEAIDPNSLVFILQNGTAFVPCSVTYDTTLTIVGLTPASALTPNTKYTVTVTAADLAGLPLVAPLVNGYGPVPLPVKSFSFTTAP